MIDWSKINFFERDEWRDFPDEVDEMLVLSVDWLREITDCIIHIHVAKDADPDAHSPGSFHYGVTARAVDLHFAPGKLTHLQQYLAISQFDFSGIGFYPFWNSPGWHLDTRQARQQRLVWTADKDGEYRYGWRALYWALLGHDIA